MNVLGELLTEAALMVFVIGMWVLYMHYFGGDR